MSVKKYKLGQTMDIITPPSITPPLLPLPLPLSYSPISTYYHYHYTIPLHYYLYHYHLPERNSDANSQALPVTFRHTTGTIDKMHKWVVDRGNVLNNSQDRVIWGQGGYLLHMVDRGYRVDISQDSVTRGSPAPHD